MDCSCGISISIKRIGDAHSRNVMWALAACVAATVIIFGGLGSIQNQCRLEDPDLLTHTSGFSGTVLGCKKIYRYYWFITALSFVTGVYGLWTTARGFLPNSRGAVMGLLVIANLLTINMTDAFYSMLDISKWQNGEGRDRARTMVAGCIITAVFQMISIILVGMEPTSSDAEETPSAKLAVPTATAKSVQLAPVAKPNPAPAPAPAIVPEAEAAIGAEAAIEAETAAEPAPEPAAAEASIAPADETASNSPPEAEAAVALTVQ